MAIQDKVLLNTVVTGLERTDSTITSVIYEQDGQQQTMPVDILISTLPLPLTGHMLGQPIQLSYRKVDAVYLYINKPLASDNHWIYFMGGNFSVNRMVRSLVVAS